MKHAVITWLKALDADFSHISMKALVSWWDRCLNICGNYVEKWCVPKYFNVSYKHLSKNKVLHIGVLVTLFSETTSQIKDSMFHSMESSSHTPLTEPKGTLPSLLDPTMSQNNLSKSKALLTFRKLLVFHSEELLAFHTIPKVEDYPLSTNHDCLFNIFIHS